MAGDLPSSLLHGGNGLRVAGHGTRHAIDGQRHAAAREHPPQPPEAGACAVFVDRFHVEVALPGPGLRADDLRQQAFGRRIAVENRALPAFLVIQDELHGDARIARPARIRRRAPIAYEVARIGSLCHEITLRIFRNGITADRIVEMKMSAAEELSAVWRRTRRSAARARSKGDAPPPVGGGGPHAGVRKSCRAGAGSVHASAPRYLAP